MLLKIIMISLDTTRADRLGCYGYSLPTTPYLDGIAANGVLFENAFASDIPTEVAHTSMFTGRVGLSTGVVSHGSSLSHLPKTVLWLPDMLRRAGYTTGAVDNMYQLKEWFARGYQYYVNSVGQERFIDGRTVTDKAKAWISQHRQEDFFLFLHYWDAHTPYLPPREMVSTFYPVEKDPYDPTNRSMDQAYNHPAYPFFKYHHYDVLGPVTDANYVSALYDAELRYQDALLEELDAFLASQGLASDTLLILVGDHGESLTEHNIYWDHCGLYEPTVHVPLVMRWPSHIPKGLRVPEFVSHVDLMPTILEAVGIEAPTGLDGQSLWPSIHGTDHQTRDALFLSECAWQATRAVRTHEFKLIRTWDSGVFVRDEVELYHLTEDPKETKNLAGELPGVTEELSLRLERWTDEILQGRPDPMEEVLKQEGLPFRRRIGQILETVGWTWDEWMRHPDRQAFDEALAFKNARR